MRVDLAKLSAFAPLMAAALAGCTGTGTGTGSGTASAGSPPASAGAPQSPVTFADGARSVGAPESCVQIRSIRETRVRDDRTIDFHMLNGRVYRNSLPNNCPSLGSERAFSYSTSLSQLCSVDIITVIYQGGGPMRGASCGLGVFQQIEQPRESAPTP
jgi:hypothetical protein